MMYYPEFKRASKKHLISCECLISLLDIECKQKERHVLTTIYYLTGYIFETILKFSIYSAIGYQRNKDVSELNSHGLEYTKYSMQTHSLMNLKEKLEAKTINRLKNYDSNKKLFNAWSSEDRYRDKIDFSKEEIILFFEFSKQTYEMLQQYK